MPICAPDKPAIIPYGETCCRDASPKEQGVDARGWCQVICRACGHEWSYWTGNPASKKKVNANELRHNDF